MKFNAITFSAALLTLALPAAGTPQIGKPAPAFSVKDSNGTSRNLQEYLGKTVVLEWTNSECPFVQKHYSSDNMQSLQRRYVDLGVIWLTVISSGKGKPGHMDGATANELTRQRMAAPTAVLLDEAGTMGRIYDARTTPHMYVIDSEGMLAYMGGVDSIATTNPEDIARATPYFTEAMDAVMTKKPVPDAVTKPYGCSIEY